MPACKPESRAEQIAHFLQAHGWGDAQQDPITGDASARRYVRLTDGPRTSMLMDAAPALEGTPCPPDASPDERAALGYTAEARLAGTHPDAFITMACALTARGFSAPRILGADIKAGLMILEDLGSALFASALYSDPDQEAQLYRAAVSCLAALQRCSFDTVLTEMRPAFTAQWPLLTYDHLALQTEADLFVDWYVPHFEKTLSAAAKAAWHEEWAAAYKYLDAHPPNLALRDFHAENIFWLPERSGSANIGLIDFQDALMGHPCYDLVSLLEDARRDVSQDLIEPLISQFCEEALIPDDEAFRAAYAVQAAQRNAKILGIFVRLAVRDNKPHYLDFIPRVQAHFINDLSHPALSGLRDWMRRFAPSALERA